MLGPDENSPTIPDRQALRPGAANNSPYTWPDDAVPMPPPPNVGRANNGGAPPVWDIPAAPKPPGPNLGGVGLGFGIAMIVLAAMALGLIIIISLNSSGGLLGHAQQTPLPSPTATLNALTPTVTEQPPVTADGAKNLVGDYYNHIGAGAFTDAFNLLGSNLQQSIGGVDQFKQQWANTAGLTVDQNSVQATPQGNTYVVTLNYTQVINQGGPATLKMAQASLTVGYEQGQLRILNQTVVDVTPTVSPSPAATPIPTSTPEISPTPTNTPTT